MVPSGHVQHCPKPFIYMLEQMRGWEEHIQARKRVCEDAKARTRVEKVSCDFLHDGRCAIRIMQVFCVVFFRSLRVYGPIHLIPLVFSPGLVTKRWVRVSVLLVSILLMK